jgi:hypothetical protein
MNFGNYAHSPASGAREIIGIAAAFPLPARGVRGTRHGDEA